MSFENRASVAPPWEQISDAGARQRTADIRSTVFARYAWAIACSAAREAPCYTFAMALVASPLGAVLVCGQCGARYEFPPSYDRRLPLSSAFAVGWGTARTDKGDFDYVCPDCLASRAVGSPIAVPDDPPPQSPKTPSQAPRPLPARPLKLPRRRSRRR